MTKSLGELRRTTDEELIAEHDKAAPSTVGGVGYYLDELARRDAQRQGDRMEHLTRVMLCVAAASAVFTLVSAGLVAWSLFWR